MYHNNPVIIRIQKVLNGWILQSSDNYSNYEYSSTSVAKTDQELVEALTVLLKKKESECQKN